MFQTFTETPTVSTSTLEFGITHQPHGGGDGAKCAFVEMVENVSNVISGEEGWIVPSADSIRVAHILDNIAQHPSA